MYILIEATKDGELVLRYEGDGSWHEVRSHPLEKNALVAHFADLMKSVGKPLSAITGLGVLPVLGRFTIVRLTVTLANTLAYVLKVPVVHAPSGCSVLELAALLGATSPGQYILPEYQAPPRLGPPSRAGEAGSSGATEAYAV